MSERMPAEIWIGGSIAPSLAVDLCDAIAQQVVSAEWGDEVFRPDSAEDLLAMVKPNRDGVRVLWLCDDQASWGRFDTLEPFLQQHKIPFTRLTAGRYEYDSERVEFRSDRGRVGYVTNAVGEPFISAAKISEVESELSRILASTGKRSFKQLLKTVQSVRGKLQEVLPPTVDPLPSFQIVVS